MALFAVAQTAGAGMLEGVGFDTSLRVEYLFGHQSTVYYSSIPRYDFDPRLALLTGSLEMSPYHSLSARLKGSTSAFEKRITVYKKPYFLTPTQAGSKWNMQPSFNSWEASGLYHLWNAEGYRFSLIGGYRQDSYKYSGPPVGDTAKGDNSRTELIAYMPIIGMQTSMFFPLWRSRFEILASPFMTRRILDFQATDYSLEAKLTKGGMLEFQWEGSMPIRPNIFLGVNASYTYMELRGNTLVNAPAVQWLAPDTDIHAYSGDSIIRLGLDVNIAF